MKQLSRTARPVKPLPSEARLHALFVYCPDTGRLSWKSRPRDEFSDDLQWKAWNGHHAGKPAGGQRAGYWGVGMVEENYLAHRVIWTMHHGPIPDGYLIDHIDGDGLNNRMDNLRLATGSDNQRNQKPNARSMTGVRGVYFNKARGCYVASVRREGKLVHLGCFHNLSEAKKAANAARAEDGYSARHLGG